MVLPFLAYFKRKSFSSRVILGQRVVGGIVGGPKDESFISHKFNCLKRRVKHEKG
jgi:hypothetical protein